jgi:hypothetical protein
VKVWICHHEDKHDTFLSVHADRAGAVAQAREYVEIEADMRKVEPGDMEDEDDVFAAWDDVAGGTGFLGIEETELDLPPDPVRAELLAALRAIRARIAGRFDDPDLMAAGPLGTESFDIDRIAEAAIRKAEGAANG